MKEILLPARPSDSLQWTIDAPAEEKILWRFDLGLETPYFPIDDEMYFQALALALSKFTREIWPIYQERTDGAILYRGMADFASHFSWTERQKENWHRWIEERPPAEEIHLRRLFCADAFAHYFQLLAHRLPDELPLSLLFNATGIGTLAERHQLMSRERFEHFQTVVEGLPFRNNEAAVALCFPEESYCTDEILKKLDGWMTNCKTPFRVIPEAFLTEEWEGVDELYVLREALSPQGERKLRGFQAAGGAVIEWGVKYTARG